MQRAGRITSSADFRRAYATGSRVAAGAVVAHLVERHDSEPARVGITAGRAVGGAVERNRVKRRLREAVRPLKASLKAGVDLVFVGTARAGRDDFQNLADSARTAASRLGACDA